jgi:hypothetical protein
VAIISDGRRRCGRRRPLGGETVQSFRLSSSAAVKSEMTCAYVSPPIWNQIIHAAKCISGAGEGRRQQSKTPLQSDSPHTRAFRAMRHWSRLSVSGTIDATSCHNM